MNASNQPQTTSNERQDGKEYLLHLLSQLFDTLNEPVAIDYHAPNGLQMFHVANEHRVKMLDKLSVLCVQLQQDEQTHNEAPDFAYIRTKLDSYERLLQEPVTDETLPLRQEAQAAYAKLLKQYMALCVTAKKQALQDRIINHAWIDQNNKLAMFNAMNAGDMPGKPSARVSMDTTQGYNFDDMPGMPNFVKQMINKGYYQPNMAPYFNQWRQGGNSYPGTPPKEPHVGPFEADMMQGLEDVLNNTEAFANSMIEGLPMKEFLKKKLRESRGVWNKQTARDEDDDDEEDDEDDD